MLAVLGITFPIFAAVALGYGLVAKGIFQSKDMKVFGAYVLNIALPALLFNAVADRPIREVFDAAYMGIYALAGVLTLTIAFVWFSLTAEPSRRGLGAMGTACPNSSFIGYPLLVMALPSVAGPAFAMNLLVENVLMVPLAIALIEFSRGDMLVSPLAKVGQVFLGVIKRPMVIGLLLGLLVSATGIVVPAPVSRLTHLIGNSAAALALIVIGGSLVGIPFAGNRKVAFQVVAGKLFLHPLLTFAMLLIFAAFGIDLSPEMRAAVLLTAAVPMLTIYTVFAQEVGHEGMASIALLGATALSFFTLSGLLLIVL